MFHYRTLLFLLVPLSGLVLAMPSDLNPSFTDEDRQDFRQDSSLANLTFTNTSWSKISNLTAETMGSPEYNASSLADLSIACFINPAPPTPPVWGHVHVGECGLLALALLGAEPPDLHAVQWTPDYPLRLPWSWGTTSYCKIRVSAITPGSLDVFPRAMVVQRAALILNYCSGDLGGIINLGPREQFQVQVHAYGPGTATSSER